MGAKYWGENVEQVSVLKTNDCVLLNRERVVQLNRQLGEKAARDVVCRAVEDIALRLERINELGDLRHLREMRKCTRSLVSIADQIGLDTLTMVADDVLCCIDEDDAVALSATWARLMRIGQQSLNEIWETQGTHK